MDGNPSRTLRVEQQHQRTALRAAADAGVRPLPRHPDMSRPVILPAIIAITAAVFGSLLFGIGVRDIYRGLRTLFWSSTSAEITHVEIIRHGLTKPTYEAAVTYRYQVAARDYTSSRISFGHTGTNIPGLAEREASTYRVGARLPVFYSPSEPAVSVLQRRMSFYSLVSFGAGIVFLGISAVIFYAMRTPRRRDRGHAAYFDVKSA